VAWATTTPGDADVAAGGSGAGAFEVMVVGVDCEAPEEVPAGLAGADFTAVVVVGRMVVVELSRDELVGDVDAFAAAGEGAVVVDVVVAGSLTLTTPSVP
jgi:hypothetical protein